MCEFPWLFIDESSTFLDMMNDIGIDKKQQYYIIKKMINIAIRATYYIFCCRNRNWDSPDLMQFWFLFVLFFFVCFVCLFVLFFVFLFLIIQSQATFVNCLCIARFTIVHRKNTNKVSIIIIIIIIFCHHTLCDTIIERLKIQKKTARFCWLRPTDW